MASLKDAEQARTEASDLLRNLGAHAISVEQDFDEATPKAVEPGQPKSAPTAGPTGAAAGSKAAAHPRSKYAVVAWFDQDPPDSVPAEIQVSHKRGSSAVPVKIRRAEAFAPEGLPSAAAKPGPDDFRPE
jgi:hypothetical protein